ncbi:hypothetical protein OPT61_g597 [Boeremia exigua]|uniref:Uncharacterized protein n=1 Tax=Boeremia exigua TaxID=749465 RepID=A0ACC2IT71_9PLEO|nr:hypothetical protein OPT61_g597 [Boeremia exigua]
MYRKRSEARLEQVSTRDPRSVCPVISGSNMHGPSTDILPCKRLKKLLRTLYAKDTDEMSLPPVRHRCSYRCDQDSKWDTIANYWLLPAHLFCSVAVAIVLLALVDGRLFLVNDSSGDAPASVVPIYQSNITTLLSIAVTTVRTLAGAWLTISGWRLAFIILESNGLNLESFGRLVCYRLPPWALDSWMLLVVLWAIFLMSAPVQFASPLVTGAVSWIPELTTSDSRQVNVTNPGDTLGFTGYQKWPNSKFFAIIQGFALSTLATTTNFSVTTQHISRRRIPSLQTSPTNTSLQEVILPFFHIESLEWIKDRSEILPHLDLFQNITSDHKFQLSIINQHPVNPYFYGGEPGRVTIAFDTPWKPAEAYPVPKVATGTRYVVLSSTRRERCNDEKADAPFGALPLLFHFDAYTGTSRFDNHRDPACYVIARMNYTAGVWTCRNCRMNSGGIVESFSVTTPVEPDPLAEQALRMVPDVLALMITSYSWQAWMKPDNLDSYTKGMLSVAYQACWNSLANIWSDETTFRQTKLSLPYPALAASIAKWRVLVWLLLNCLLTFSGILIVYLQKGTRAKTVRNPELSALLLDTKRLIEDDTSGLCNAVKADKTDNCLIMRLQCSDGNEAAYQHPYVEVRSHLYHELPQDHSLETLQINPK